MIKSFRHSALQRFFETGEPGDLGINDNQRVRRILLALASSYGRAEIKLPGFDYREEIDTDRYSVRVTGGWRIFFGWDGRDVIDVDLEDRS
jgi:proteic killer suppression protein